MKIVRTIFFKIFSWSFLFSSLLFSFLWIYTAKATHTTFIDQKKQDTRDTVETYNRYLDLYLQSITAILFSFTEIQNIHEMSDTDIQRILAALAGSNPEIIGGAYFIRPDGRFIGGNQLILDIIGPRGLSILKSRTSADMTRISWSEPYYSPRLVATTVAFWKPVFNRQRELKGVGVIEIQLNTLNAYLSELFYPARQYYAVFSESTNPIVLRYLHTRQNMLAKYLRIDPDPEYTKILRELPFGMSDLEYEGRVLYAYKSDSNRLSWELIGLVDEDIYQNKIHELNNTFLRIGIVMILLLLVGNIFVSRHLSNPIHRLALQMDTIREYETIRVRRTPKDNEIGRLYSSFYSLMDRLRDSLRRQREGEARKRIIELRLLQRQIRPHFLGNILACVGSLAKQGRTAEVEEMIRNILLLLMTSIDSMDEFIPLESELEFLHAYIDLQRMRFGNRFDFSVLVPKEQRTVLVPKLLLEPLVENSIVHGFSRKRSSEVIIVTTHMTDGELCIDVGDNGSGIEPRTLDRLHRALDGHTEDAHTSGIGLINVHHRLNLYYGPRYGIRIKSTPEKGTVVSLRMPVSRDAE